MYVCTYIRYFVLIMNYLFVIFVRVVPVPVPFLGTIDVPINCSIILIINYVDLFFIELGTFLYIIDINIYCTIMWTFWDLLITF